MLEREFFRDPTLEEYLGGAFLIFGIVTLVLQVSGGIITYKGLEEKFYTFSPILLLLLYFLLHIGSAWLGSYLVVRRIRNTRIRLIRAGLLTGLAAYVVEALTTLLIVRAFPESLWALIGYLSGGCLGGYTVSFLTSRKAQEKPSEAE
ncbi:MAG: hypothetical protein DRO05_05265 [Thermoproteota archaeon]|nr:MAG: hypothetical protein DRO05_05265 [Candidatus Korarchaeota archaeon]